MTNLNIDIESMIQGIESVLAYKDYDSFEVREVGFRPNGWKTGFYCEIRVDDGEVDFLNYAEPTFSDLLAKLHEIPSREMRELRRMTAKMAEIQGMAEHIRSLKVQEFTQQILDDAKPLFAMLEHKGES